MEEGLADEQCTNCRIEAFLDPSVRLMLSTICSHVVCEKCFNAMYQSRTSAPCPSCHLMLTRQQYVRKDLDTNVERENAQRKRLVKFFTRQPSEFLSLREYNDYLEGMEDLIFNMVHNIDVEETKLKFQQYKEKYSGSISAGAARMAEEERIMKGILSAEDQAKESGAQGPKPAVKKATRIGMVTLAPASAAAARAAMPPPPAPISVGARYGPLSTQYAPLSTQYTPLSAQYAPLTSVPPVYVASTPFYSGLTPYLQQQPAPPPTQAQSQTPQSPPLARGPAARPILFQPPDMYEISKGRRDRPDLAAEDNRAAAGFYPEMAQRRAVDQAFATLFA
eukprot:TRINITY_DN643_c4_g1_i1.p1 TRINITY_DN643_c4_g1~~TRINITY_DN643_c4_g1_i1.p1  ORF type:complete len:336 (+),score=74.68 TRINITY_DN643_c4_g1_i1:92-1099(+)